MNCSFFGKTIENVQKKVKVEFVKKDDGDNLVKRQSKTNLNGIHKSHENNDSFTFKHNEVLVYEPIYLVFVVLDLSVLLLYETYYDKLQPYFGENNIESYYIDTDALVLSLNTNDGIKVLYNLKDLFNSSTSKKITKYSVTKTKRKGGWFF